MGSIYRGPGIRTDLPTTQQTFSTRATSTAESTTSTEVSIWSTSIPSIKSVTIEPTSDLPSSSLSSSPSSSSSSILHLLSIILPVFLASLSMVLTVVWFLRYRCRSLTLDRQLEITVYQISPEGNSNLQKTDKEVAVQIADNGGKRGSLTVKGCPVDTSQGIDNGPLSNGGLGIQNGVISGRQNIENIEELVNNEPARGIIRQITGGHVQNNEIRQIYIIEYSTRNPEVVVSPRYRDPASIQGQVSDILPSYQERDHHNQSGVNL